MTKRTRERVKIVAIAFEMLFLGVAMRYRWNGELLAAINAMTLAIFIQVAVLPLWLNQK